MKKFFGYTKYYSVTEMVLALGLPSFDTVIHNYRNLFLSVWSNHSNYKVKLLRCVCPSAFLCFIVHLVSGADPAIGGPGGRLPLRAWLCAFTV